MQESPALERVLLMNYKHYQAVDDSAFISDVFDILESVSRLRNPYSQAAALLLLNLPELLPDEAFSALADHLTSKQSSDAVLLLFLIGACIGKFRRLVDVCNRQLFRVLERVDKLNSDILPLVLLPAVVATNTLASEAEAKKKGICSHHFSISAVLTRTYNFPWKWKCMYMCILMSIQMFPVALRLSWFRE